MDALGTHCVRNAGGAIPNLSQHSQTNLQVAGRDRFNQFVTQVAGGLLNFLEQGARFCLELDGLAAAIVRRILAFDPAVLFEFAQQSRESWFFDPESLREVALGEMAAREMGEGAPPGLTQAERAQALIEPVAPDPRGLLDELANGFRIDPGHR
jgi:hypothetical protein